MDRQNDYFLLGIKTATQLFFTIFIIGLIAISTLAQKSLIAEKYLRIKPIVSTRDDVEKLFGKSDSKKYNALYQTPDAVVEITYSRGGCDSGDMKWGIPEGAIEEIFYVPRVESLRLTDVILNFAKFKKRQEGDVLDHITYRNNENGISIVYDKSEKTVTSITISPTAEQKKHFACATAK